MKWRELKQSEEKRDSDVNVIRARQEEHLAAYKAQLEQKRKIGRYKTRPTGPREKEIQIDTFPTVHVVIKGKTSQSNLISSNLTN